MEKQFDPRVEWIFEYFNIKGCDLIKFEKQGAGMTGNEFVNIYFHMNDFGALIIEIDNIEVVENHIALFPMPDIKEKFEILMSLLGFEKVVA